MVKTKNSSSSSATEAQNQGRNRENCMKPLNKRPKRSKKVDVKVSEPCKNVGHSCLQLRSDDSVKVRSVGSNRDNGNGSPTKILNSNADAKATGTGAPQYIYYKRNGVLKKRRVVAKDGRKVIFLKKIDIKNCYPEPPHNTSAYIMDLHETGEHCPSHIEHCPSELEDAESESNTSDLDLEINSNQGEGEDDSDMIELIPFSTFSVWNGDSLFE